MTDRVNIHCQINDSKHKRFVYIWNHPIQRLYPGLLRHQEYNEVNESVMEILNQDWKRKPYIRIACGQLLAGSILVEGNEVLLINCIELYNQNLSLDPHYEKFGLMYMVGSGPSLNNKYNGINIISKVEDRSKKLLISTLVFNALVTSSLRLDHNYLPEVGASTFLFSPTKDTKLYLSSRSIEQANKTIGEKLELANLHDLDSQLRQVKSRLASPLMYTSARFSS
ncbi:hypothetical protein EDC94DRAFT_608046 [Helicostylum pulchrum]|nr:hypothetical protein EDC94DRAFT_608046 [Helicostylum pulchrum]